MESNDTDGRQPDVGFDAPELSMAGAAEATFYAADSHVRWVEYALMSLVGASVIGLGGQVHGDTMLRLIQSPLAICTGMFCRLALMPALLLGVTTLLSPSHHSSLSLLCLVMSPSEGASCLLALLAEADVELCLGLTAVNAFTTTAVFPLWTILFERELYGAAGFVAIPFREIFIIFGILLSSSFIGYLFREKWPDLYDKYWTYLPFFAMFTIVCIIGVEIYLNYISFAAITAMRFTVASLMAVLGFVLAAFVGYLLRQTQAKIIALALEIGVRTTYITNLFTSMSYAPADAQEAKAASVLCSMLSLLPAFIIVLVYRVRSRSKMIEDDRQFLEERALAKECLTMMREPELELEEKERTV